MTVKRILSYEMSKLLNESELQDISAAGTSHGSGEVTYSQTGGKDGNVDVILDGE